MPPHERRKPKDNETKRVKDKLLVILQKVNEHHEVLEELRKNVNVINHMISSNSRFIHLIEYLMGQVLPHLCQKQ